MKKLFKKYNTIIHILIITLVILLEIALIVNDSYVFGYSGDWFIQSTSFYEYFRNLFYNTGEIFPNLALHIGGGQNIYYFAYYGLFSPYLLLMYLFPSVRAGDFIMITGVLNLILSSILFYFFLIKNNFNKNISLFGALLLSTCTSFVVCNFQFIMFVQYMPFLILGLFGTKKYLDEHKSLLLIISVVLIITTSYYFSIPSIICLCLYALYYYLKINDKVNFKGIFKCGIKYVLKIMLGIMIASFLLLPILYIIFNGGTSVNFNININDFIPKIYMVSLMYHNYGLGLSSILWFSIIYNILFLKKEDRMLSIVLLIIISLPICNLLLNCFLYVQGKIFIPFVPLFILLILKMLDNINKTNYKKVFLIFCLSTLISALFFEFFTFLKTIIFYCDLLMVFILLLLCKKRNNNNYIYVVICFAFVVTICYIGKRDILFIKQDYNNVYDILELSDDYIKNDNSNIYRTMYNKLYVGINYSDANSIFIPTMYSSTYNKTYREIFYNVFNNNHEDYNLLLMPSVKNLFFNRFMGVRYLFADDTVPYGYEKNQEFDDITLYENDNVYSLGFTLPNLLNYAEYNKLSFIERLLAYQNNIIINGDSNNSDLDFNYKKVDLDYEIKNLNNIKYTYKDNCYIVNSKNDAHMTLSLKEKLKDKTLIVRFNVDSDLFDHLSIIINDIKNTLSYEGFHYDNNNTTFDYVISSNEEIEELNIEFYEGTYYISDIEVYAIDNEFFDKNNTTPLEIDFDKTKGDDIYGSIDVLEDGYFIFTIPYDKGYTVYVDNKEVEIEQVSGGFIGFKINKGNHDVHLTFEAPYAKLGRIISLIGIIILIILNIYEKNIIKKKDK